MATNGNAALTWKQIPVVVGIMIVFGMLGGYIYTKADKIDLIRVEHRCSARIDSVRDMLKEDILEIKTKLDRMNDMLLTLYLRNHKHNSTAKSTLGEQ